MSDYMVQWDFTEGMEVSEEMQDLADGIELSEVSAPTESKLAAVTNAMNFYEQLDACIASYKDALTQDGKNVASRTQYLYTTDTDLSGQLNC